MINKTLGGLDQELTEAEYLTRFILILQLLPAVQKFLHQYRQGYGANTFAKREFIFT